VAEWDYSGTIQTLKQAHRDVQDAQKFEEIRNLAESAKKLVHKARAASDRHTPEQQNLGIATFLTLAFL